MTWYKQGPSYLERYKQGEGYKQGKPIMPGEGLGIAQDWTEFRNTFERR